MECSLLVVAEDTVIERSLAFTDTLFQCVLAPLQFLLDRGFALAVDGSDSLRCAIAKQIGYWEVQGTCDFVGLIIPEYQHHLDRRVVNSVQADDRFFPTVNPNHIGSTNATLHDQTPVFDIFFAKLAIGFHDLLYVVPEHATLRTLVSTGLCPRERLFKMGELDSILATAVRPGLKPAQTVDKNGV